MSGELVRFPQERCGTDARVKPGHLCVIVVLPVVRIERYDQPLLGRRQARRVRKALDMLREPKR